MQKLKSHTYISLDLNGRYELTVDVDHEREQYGAWIRKKDGLVMTYIVGVFIQQMSDKYAPVTLPNFLAMVVGALAKGNLEQLVEEERYYTGRLREELGQEDGPDAPDAEPDEECFGFTTEGVELTLATREIMEYQTEDGCTIAVSYDATKNTFSTWLSDPDEGIKFLCSEVPGGQDGHYCSHDMIASATEAGMNASRRVQILKKLLEEGGMPV